MIQWREGRVLRERGRWAGAVELEVAVVGAPGYLDEVLGEDAGCRALAYPALVGEPRPGELVLLNTTALEAGLGTGGYAFVVAVPHRPPIDPDLADGHLVKARYTPQQVTVLGTDEQRSPHHDLLRDADDLFGMPVVVADLHSSLPAVIAGVRTVAGAGARVAYVMTDGGALPAWFSRTVAGLRHAGWLATCVTMATSALSTCRAASSPVCTVPASRSPPKAWPVVTVPARCAASPSRVRENQAGSAPPSVITYATRAPGPAMVRAPAITAGRDECRSAATTGMPNRSSASRSRSWCGERCSSVPTTVTCCGV